MKSWIFIPVALLLGLIIGSWGPRSDVRHLEKELKNTKKLLKERSRPQGANIDGIARMLNIEQASATSHKTEPAPGRVRLSPNEQAPTDPASTNAADPSRGSLVFSIGTPPPTEGQATNNVSPEARRRPMKERIDEAIELWKIRSDMARNTFISNTGLHPRQAAKFDVLVDAMNLRVGKAIEEFATAAKSEEHATEESFIRLANEITGAVVLGYKELDRTMPGSWRDKAGKDFSMTDFIDPGVARPMIDVEDKLDNRRRWRD